MRLSWNSNKLLNCLLPPFNKSIYLKKKFHRYLLICYGFSRPIVRLLSLSSARLIFGSFNYCSKAVPKCYLLAFREFTSMFFLLQTIIIIYFTPSVCRRLTGVVRLGFLLCSNMFNMWKISYKFAIITRYQMVM